MVTFIQSVFHCWQRLNLLTVTLTEFEVSRFIGIHAVGIATIDVGPHRHCGVCKDIIGTEWQDFYL